VLHEETKALIASAPQTASAAASRFLRHVSGAPANTAQTSTPPLFHGTVGVRLDAERVAETVKVVDTFWPAPT
jgi:hypothetical protein